MKYMKYDTDEIAKLIQQALSPEAEDFVGFEEFLDSQENIELDYSQIENVDVDGVDFKDAPEFTDAYICSATYKGRKMTDAELDVLNEDYAYVYEAVTNKIY